VVARGHRARKSQRKKTTLWLFKDGAESALSSVCKSMKKKVDFESEIWGAA
jgi:hypothetical protein